MFYEWFGQECTWTPRTHYQGLLIPLVKCNIVVLLRASSSSDFGSFGDWSPLILRQFELCIFPLTHTRFLVNFYTCCSKRFTTNVTNNACRHASFRFRHRSWWTFSRSSSSYSTFSIIFIWCNAIRSLLRRNCICMVSLNRASKLSSHWTRWCWSIFGYKLFTIFKLRTSSLMLN